MPYEGYSVKEVVDITRKEQTAGFAKLEVLLSTKADKTDVERLATDLSSHRKETDRRFAHLEDANTAATALAEERDRSKSDRWGFWGLIAATAAAAGAVAGAIVFAVH